MLFIVMGTMWKWTMFQGVKFQKFWVGLWTRGLGNSQVEMPLRKMNTSTLNLDFGEYTSMGRPQRQHKIVLKITSFIIATFV